MLTPEDLKAMKPNEIFASGEGLMIHPWFNEAKLVTEGGSLEPDHLHTRVNWVAVRGNIEDWAIYHSLDSNLENANYLDGQFHLTMKGRVVADFGAKLHNRELIKEWVPCSGEALLLYRD